MANGDVNGAEIRRRREAVPLTVREAALQAKWGENGFARWQRLESGKSPNPELATLQTVARVLKCKVQDLLK